MNNNIQLFNYGENPVRTIEQDGEIWFVAKDICDILELANVSQALSTLDDDEKNTLCLSEGNKKKGNPNMNIINESGLYTLIFKSIKPEAREFRRWVTGTVLPQIRKTGSFTVELSEETQPKQKALPDSALQSEIVNTKRRIEYFKKMYLAFINFDKSVFKYRDNGCAVFRIWDDFLDDDRRDLHILAGLLDLFKSFNQDKIRSLEDKLKALETIAKF